MCVTLIWSLNIQTDKYSGAEWREPTAALLHTGEVSFFILSVSFVCLIHRCHCRASVITISADTVLNLTWKSPPWPRPRPWAGLLAPVTKTWRSAGLSGLFVIWSTCRQLESWLCGDLWWHCTRATAGQCFAPDVKGAKNQHQVCSIDPCAGGRGGPFN